MNNREEFLKKLNEAFAESDTEYILGHVTEDIRWNIIGENLIEGKEAYGKALKEMEAEEPFDLTINNIITYGDSAAVDGRMESPDGKTYAFCDVYKFNGTKNNLKIEEIISYVIELKPQIA